MSYPPHLLQFGSLLAWDTMEDTLSSTTILLCSRMLQLGTATA